MKSWWIRKEGEGTVLERRNEPVPQLQGNEMLVRVKATSINRGDLLARIKRHSADKPRPIGGDGAGEVVDPGTSDFKVGDRVFFRAHGTFAEFAAIDPALAARIPDHFDYELAAAVPAVFVTAWEGLFGFGKARAGDWVLVCGASSGVGVAALQMARHIGARVIATSGSSAKQAALEGLGAEAVVQSRGSAFADEVLRVTGGRGVDVSLNLVGGSAFPGCVRAAANFGRVVMVGYVDRQMNAEFDLEALHGRRLEIYGTSNTPLALAQRAAAMDGFMRHMFPAIASGQIRPVVDRVYGFDEVEAAKSYVEADQHLGKVIVRID
jgi:NADPH2:quinone reductase